MIGRGNTCYLAYPIPEFADDIEVAYVTYYQHGKVVLEKEIIDMDFDYLLERNNHIIVKLSQEESLLFKETVRSEKDMVEVHIRIRTFDGEAFGSQVFNERVQKTLKEGVI